MGLRKGKTLKIDRTEEEVRVLANGDLVVAYGHNDIESTINMLPSESRPDSWRKAAALGLRMFLLGRPDEHYGDERRQLMSDISKLFCNGDPWAELEDAVIAISFSLMAEATKRNSPVVDSRDNMIELHYLNDLCRGRLEILGVMHLLAVHVEETDPGWDFESEEMVDRLEYVDDYLGQFVDGRSCFGNELKLDADLKDVLRLAVVREPLRWYTSKLLFWDIYYPHEYLIPLIVTGDILNTAVSGRFP